MQIIPMRELKNTVEIERRCAEENGPVFVTKNGYGRLVVMDIDYYDRTMKEMEEAKLIMEGLRDVEQGLSLIHISSNILCSRKCATPAGRCTSLPSSRKSRSMEPNLVAKMTWVLE